MRTIHYQVNVFIDPSVYILSNAVKLIVHGKVYVYGFINKCVNLSTVLINTLIIAQCCNVLFLNSYLTSLDFTSIRMLMTLYPPFPPEKLCGSKGIGVIDSTTICWINHFCLKRGCLNIYPNKCSYFIFS